MPAGGLSENPPGRAPDFDPDQLEILMAAVFEVLGKPQVRAQELSKGIPKWPRGVNPAIKSLLVAI